MDVTKAQASEDQRGFDALFSTRRPKDAAAGLSSGLKSISKGLLGGVAALVALPIKGAQEEGPLGFAKGLGIGIVSAVGMVVVGAGTGIVQLGRGIINTPSAIQASHEEMVWDEDLRIWFKYNLPQEAARLEEQIIKGPEVPVADMRLYNVLQISSVATGDDIKKAYRKKAIQLHPDKNPNDEKASERFQELGEAYQILSNPKLRAAYDQKGDNPVKESGLLDSAHLFLMIFGSERFESYVGELQLLSMQESVKSAQNDSSEMTYEKYAKAEAETKLKQQKREVHCAVSLAKILDTFKHDVSEDHHNFKMSVEGEAKELAETVVGGTLVGVLAYVYQEQAFSFLGFKESVASGLGFSGIARNAHIMANKTRLVSSAIKTYTVAKKAEANANAKKVETEGQEESIAKNVPDLPQGGVESIIETLWNYTVLDVEATVRSVCMKVFKDSSISLEDRQMRAKALILLAEVFKAKSQTVEAGLAEIGQKIKGAEGPVQES